MTIFIRRSLKVGLLVAGLVCVGAGTASARGTSADSVGANGSEQQQVTRHQPTVMPRYVVKRGPVGTVIDGVTRDVKKIAPPHGMQPMHAAAAPQPAPRYVPVARPGATAPRAGTAKVLAKGLMTPAPAAPAPNPAAATKGTRTACPCGAQLTLGPPTVNALAADSAPGASVEAAKAAAFKVPVTNEGPSAVHDLAMSSAIGGFSCASTALASGQTTNCTTTTDAVLGPQVVPVTATAKDPLKAPLTASRAAYYKGLSASSVGRGTLDPGSPTVNGDPAGTAPGPQVDPGSAANVVASVTNNGDATVTGVTATSPDGALSCADTTLAPGASTTCAVTVTAGTGAQSLLITFNGADPSGPLSASTTVHYTGNAPGSGPGGQGTTGTPVTGSGTGTSTGTSTGSTSQVSTVPSGAPNTGGGTGSGSWHHQLMLAGLLMLGLAGFAQAARRRGASRP